MTEHHWFDAFSKAAVHARTRREIARSLAALLPALLLGGLVDAAGKKKGSKGKGNGKRKDKKKKEPVPQPPPTAPDSCDTTWSEAKDREHCRFIREQCDGDDPREFCIRDGTKPDGTPTKVAVCCEEDQECCGSQCCPRNRCCNGTCCGAPLSEVKCCDDRCINTNVSREHCGFCDNACEADEICQLGHCVPGCGQSGLACSPPTPWCINGECHECAQPGRKLCETSIRPHPMCVPGHFVCCPGRVVCGQPGAFCCGNEGGVVICSVGGECFEGFEPIPAVR